MKTLRCFAPIALVALVGITGCEQQNQPAPDARPSTPAANRAGATDSVPDADNTARNRRDATQDTKTSLDQSESGRHVQITADIRRAIMDDDNMSMNAQNCKIITDASGMVTLRGPVESQAEKDAIDAKARAIAGATKVDNQLEVKLN